MNVLNEVSLFNGRREKIFPDGEKIYVKLERTICLISVRRDDC